GRWLGGTHRQRRRDSTCGRCPREKEQVMAQQPAPAFGQEPWRRAMVGAALSIVLFTVFTLPTWFLISAGTDSTDGWADLGYVAFMILVLLVLPPVALATAFLGGMPIDKRTWTSTPRQAAVWFAYLAAVPAALAAGLAFLSGPI